MEDLNLENLKLKPSSQEPFIFEVTKIDGVFSFLKTIDWSEKWLWPLILFHFVTFLMIFFSKRCSNFQIGVFLTLVIACYGSERLNELGAQYWRHFSSEQYFDSNGLFISIVFSFPIIINCCFLLILWLYESYLMIKNIIRQKRLAKTKKS
ncbi:unnamed protein product [Brachionus calyciflorus]|uniref:Transmembrane protein 18 n=1 Tax=Brachionus calyciflorus TaxID=104777 RepID=A0A813PXR9_9BILA|nr:unnamed protein product [Brachionus calyciflorus]